MPLVEILLVLGLVLLNGLLAMAEMAIVSARRAGLRQLAEQGHAGARAALRLQADPNRFLSTVQAGITLVGVLNGAFSGVTLARYLIEPLASLGLGAAAAHSVALAVVVAGITYLSLVIGELVPKRLALQHAEAVAIRVARPLDALAVAGRPLVWLLERSTAVGLRLLGVERPAEPRVTEEEVRSLLAEGTASGIFDPREHAMIEGVLRIADHSVRSIMTPRVDVVWLDVDSPAESIRATMTAHGHSRYPVGRGGLGALVGVVQTKDLVGGLLAGQPLDLGAAVAEPLMVPEGTPILRLIERFRSARVHLAIVVDEYGTIEGIVTPLDVLEAIAGELPEEHDQDPLGAVRRADGSWLVDGRLSIHETARLLGLHGMDHGEDYATLAGFVLWQLRRLPGPGDGFVWHDLWFEVVDMDGRRIDKVLIQPQPKAEA
jgi:putative hemolysin